ncbi:hypothetical protein BMS3Abin07_00143 [bacterium BMS3Abin07]|nr:hypothetical protein BMS3Abin07_00143 [bacterium BMS3Abin07]
MGNYERNLDLIYELEQFEAELVLLKDAFNQLLSMVEYSGNPPDGCFFIFDAMQVKLERLKKLLKEMN